MDTVDVMTVNELPGIFKLNSQRFRKWIGRGQLAVLHVGRRVPM